jgi:hypothetical protein
MKTVSGVAAVIALGALLAACAGSDLGVGSAVKELVVGKPAPEPDIPDRPRLSMPPPNAALPPPGDSSAQPQTPPSN